MSSVAIEIGIVLGLILLNAVFALSEMALVSSRRARLQQRADDGDAGAEAALALSQSPQRFLSTVQIGITLVGIVAGAFGGATLTQQLAPVIAAIPALAPYATPVAGAIVVLVITYLSLVIGELVPKAIALQNPEGISSAVARPMGLLSRLAAPFVWLLTKSTGAVLRLLRVRPTDDPPVTEDEIRIMIAQGAEAGVFELAEQDLVAGVFRLGDQTVEDLMTPRPRIVWLDAADSLAEVWQTISNSHYSYFPVYAGTPDNVLGIVSVKDIWVQMVEGQPIDLRSLASPPLFVPESMQVFNLLEAFKQSRQHVALVIDEYGGIQGLVSLTDVLEGIVGDLPQPGETEVQVVQRDDGSWLVDGMLPVEEMREAIPLGALPGEERGDYQTVAGFVLSQLGRIPRAGESFTWGGYRFEIVDMDGHRVDKLLVAPTDHPTPGS